MLDSEDLDGVSICTPNFLHFPMIMEALKRDVSILCEKPVCITLDECIKVESFLKEKDLIFFTAFHKRYLSVIPLLKQLLIEERLGDITMVRYFFSHLGPYTSHNARSKIRWFYDSKMAGGGVVLDLAVHSIDLLRYLIGEYSVVEGYSEKTSCLELSDEDTGTIIFKFKSGPIGNISVSWCCQPTELIEIFGRKGTLTVDLTSKVPCQVYPKELIKDPLIKELSKHKLSTIEPHHLLIDDFVKSFRTKNQKSPNFTDGKRAVEFALDAYDLRRK